MNRSREEEKFSSIEWSTDYCREDWKQIKERNHESLIYPCEWISTKSIRVIRSTIYRLFFPFLSFSRQTFLLFFSLFFFSFFLFFLLFSRLPNTTNFLTFTSTRNYPFTQTDAYTLFRSLFPLVLLS